MKIKLMCRDINLIKVDNNSSKLMTRNTGTAIYSENAIYFDGESPFETCLHEIFHFYLERIGINQMETIDKEVMCDLFSNCINQLMIENGKDIFIMLRAFAE